MKQKHLFKNGYFAIKKCRHGFFAYNTNDTTIGKALDLYGEWAEPEIKALISLLAPRDIVIDVGAYIGTHTIPFAKAVSPGGGVYAIEPQRTAFAYLNTNVAINNLMNVITINKFALDSLKKVISPILDQSIAQNYGSLGLKSFKGGELVETMTIDSLKLSRVALIKIDTEGSEYQVLCGAESTIRKFEPVLYIENTNIEKSRKIISKVFSFGYRTFWHIFNYYNPQNYFGNKQNIFLEIHPEANIVCFPKKSSVKPKRLIPVEGITDTWKKAVARILKTNQK